MSAQIQVRLKQVRFTDYDANGFLGIQCDAYGEQESGVPACEAKSPYGIYGRPPDPEVAGPDVVFGAGVLELKDGDESYAFALHDPRLIPGFPQLKKGETVVYGPAFNFTRYHADGRISTMCTSDLTADGQMVAYEQGPDGWTWNAPWGIQRNDATGFHYRHASGARFDVGGISGVPAPLGAASSYWKLEAFLVSIKGVTVQLGTGAYEPAAKALVTLSVLAAQAAADTAQAAANAAVAAALSALGAIPANAAASGPCAAAATALGVATAAQSSAVSAIAASATTLPARSVSVA